jgi:cellulose synthase/poly-beta-1,6-N-acetylglucosamine synthase-like glycosyltransferase
MFLLLFGVNFVLWGGVGLVRFAHESSSRRRSTWNTKNRRVRLDDVAVLMAAHNEEVVIEDSLSALLALTSPRDVYVVSDFSTDRTVELARGEGVNVVETPSNVGKAGALDHGIEAFDLIDRYEAVMLLDADTRLDPEYFAEALPLLDDPEVVAVAGCAHSHWRTGGITWAGCVITAHRSRVYALTQRLIKYGQTWQLTNATHIVPGFASLYRTRALRQININPPGWSSRTSI